jgi:hypothetical protein
MDADDRFALLEKRLQQIEADMEVVRERLWMGKYHPIWQGWPSPPPPPPMTDDFGRPPRPPEPQLRIIKEGSIPPRTDGHVSWWRKWIMSVRGPDF